MEESQIVLCVLDINISLESQKDDLKSRPVVQRNLCSQLKKREGARPLLPEWKPRDLAQTWPSLLVTLQLTSLLVPQFPLQFSKRQLS